VQIDGGDIPPLALRKKALGGSRAEGSFPGKVHGFKAASFCLRSFPCSLGWVMSQKLQQAFGRFLRTDPGGIGLRIPRGEVAGNWWRAKKRMAQEGVRMKRARSRPMVDFE
jgi:hypothetical protein